MYKIAVIGDKESVIGFSCVGVDSFTVTDKNQAAVMLKSLSSDGYGIIFITEALASDLKEEIIKYIDQNRKPLLEPTEVFVLILTLK